MNRLSFIIFLCFISTVGQCQLANLDFEDWDSTSTPRLKHWEHLQLYNGSPDIAFIGTHMESNAEHGKYALTLNRWYSGEEFEWVRQKASYALKPDHISGYYKYTDNQIGVSGDYDTALVAVYLTKWNSTNNNNDTIGIGKAKLNADSSYTSFTCPIVYTTGETPDSITLDIMPTYYKMPGKGSGGACTDPSGSCSYLTIDNLSVSPPTDVSHIVTSDFDIYPNPVQDKLTIHTSKQIGSAPVTICIANVIGNIVLRGSIEKENTVLDLSTLHAGNYFIILQGADGKMQVKRLLKAYQSY